MINRKMKILSLCSEIINDKLDSKDIELIKVNYEYLPNIIYEKYQLALIGNRETILLQNIDTNCDVVLIDFISILDKAVEYRGILFSENQINRGKNVVDEDMYDIWINITDIILNKLLRYYRYDQIYVINFAEINEQSQYKNIYEKVKGQFPILNEINLDNKKNDTNEYELIIEKINNNLNSKKYKSESIYTSTRSIRYIFEKATLFNKDKLIVIFSSFSTDVPKYNYINTLKCIDGNKLFILDDYGSKGSYYIGIDGGFEIETSVISLITHIMNENNITFNNVISIGSSKGGSAALYYGLKYNFGNVIAGAPQYKIGTYLIDLSIKDYANDIFGGLEPSKRIKYDNLIKMVAKEGQATKISILTGDGDPQYKRVLRDFETVAEEFKLNLKLDKCSIENHNEISKVFPKYMITSIEEIFNGKGCIKGNMLLNILSKFN